MTKRTFWIGAAILAWFGCDGARAQQKQPLSSLQEDCGVTFEFTTASSGAQAAGTVTAGSTGTTAVIDNRKAGCTDWVVTYEPNTATASVSLAFQTATDVLGVPGTWSNYPGTLTAGINPNTAVTTGGAKTEASGVQYPFLRMNMTVITGAGARIQGKLTGWKKRPPITANAVIVPGTLCPAGTPCAVDGPNAAGTAPTFPPVLTGGQDGTNVRTILTDTSGRQRVVGAAADGAAVAGDPVRVGGKDGSGNTQDIATDTSGNQAVIGTKTNNAAVPGTNNLGVLPCLANAAAPSWTEGDQVLCSVDLTGALRVVSSSSGTGDVNLVEVAGDPVVTAGLAGLLAVGGPDASGQAPTGNPLLIAGLDVQNAGDVTSIQTDPYGGVVAGSHTAPIDTVFVSDIEMQVASGGNNLTLQVIPFLHNPGSTVWDAAPGNTLGAFVQGFDPTGSSRQANPVVMGGEQFQAGNIDIARFEDNSLGLIVDGPESNAGSPLSDRLFPVGVFDGTLLNYAYSCTLSAPVTVSAAATTEIVAADGSKNIRLCGFSISLSLAGTIQFKSGTGVDCGTGTANLTGAMSVLTGGSKDILGTTGLFSAGAGNALCLAAVTGNAAGFVYYAQF